MIDWSGLQSVNQPDEIKVEDKGGGLISNILPFSEEAPG